MAYRNRCDGLLVGLTVREPIIVDQGEPQRTFEIQGTTFWRFRYDSLFQNGAGIRQDMGTGFSIQNSGVHLPRVRIVELSDLNANGVAADDLVNVGCFAAGRGYE